MGGPFRAQAEVIDIVRGTDGLTRLNLGFRSEEAAERAKEVLRRAGLLPSAGCVTVHSQIPSTHSGKADIEQALEEAFLEAPGSWTVVLLAAGFGLRTMIRRSQAYPA